MKVYIIVRDARKDGSYIVSVHSTPEGAAIKMAKIAEDTRGCDYCDGEIYTTEEHYYIVRKTVDEN